MTGSSIFEYIHEADRHELAEELGLTWPQRSENITSTDDQSDENSNPGQNRTNTPPLERGNV